jgi:hypothetical protein
LAFLEKSNPMSTKFLQVFEIGVCRLGFIWDLGFGIWDFELHLCYISIDKFKLSFLKFPCFPGVSTDLHGYLTLDNHGFPQKMAVENKKTIRSPLLFSFF